MPVVRHYSRRTEDAYVHWIRRYIVFHKKVHPSTIGTPEISTFLTWLAVEQGLSALAKELVRQGALPEKATVDAFHIGVAAAHQVTYLLTWNCKHLANATMRGTIEAVCRSEGLNPPIICTPEELPARKPS